MTMYDESAEVVTIDNNTPEKSTKKDAAECIYLSDKGKCLQLSIDECTGSDCSFLLTREDATEEKYKWATRLCALDEAKQRDIAKKYYGGAMPWKAL